jgi:hypothetical protein
MKTAGIPAFSSAVETGSREENASKQHPAPQLSHPGRFLKGLRDRAACGYSTVTDLARFLG